MAIEFDEMREVISPLEYVIQLGMQGNHVLFDNDRIRMAFTREEDELMFIGTEHVEEVREAIRNIMSIPQFESKKDYISSLPSDIQDVIIFLYFQMIEKTITTNQRNRH